MALEAQNNPFTSILMVGAADPEALASDVDPSAGSYRLVMGTDDVLYILDETGNATAVGGAAGAVATDAIWDAAGDLVQGTGANTAAKLGAGTAGMMLQSAGAAAANLWAFPPGYEAAYAAITSNVTVTATTEGAAHTVVATSSFTAENLPYMIEVFTPRVDIGAAGLIIMDLYVDSTILGRVGILGAAGLSQPFVGKMRHTPTAGSRTYTWKVWRATADGTVYAGAGGTATNVPAYIRVTKV